MPKAVVKKHIEDSLKNIISLFQKESKSSYKLSYISLQRQLPKLATIELCGWIEDTQDRIVMRSIKSSNIKPPYIDKFYKDYVKTNNAFRYKDYRKMLTQALGQKTILLIEKELDRDIQILQSKLADLKTMRDSYAHSHTPSVANIKSPLHIYNDYYIPIFKTLKLIEDKIIYINKTTT